MFSALWALLLCQLLTSTFAQVRFTRSLENSSEAPEDVGSAGDGGTFRPNLHVTLGITFFKTPHALSVAVFLVWSFRVEHRCRVFRTIP